jgi:hypothetical protein
VGSAAVNACSKFVLHNWELADQLSGDVAVRIEASVE